MSIADKLNYLITTKGLLKDNINKINNVLTDQSTFRSYPQELFNGYLDILNNGTDTLWNNLEKVSQTGTEAVLEGVETAPMKMVLNGNTSQDGTPTPDTPVEVKVVKGENTASVSGKNLFDKDNQAKVQVNAEGTLRYGIIVNAPNKKVSISGKNWSGYITYKPLTNGVYGQWVNINRDITINVTDKLIIYASSNFSKLGTYVDDLQIEISDMPTSYVPYSKTDYPINLGDIELCKINTYKDFPFKAINGNEYYDSLTDEQKNALNYGSWYVHKAIGKVVLDGSESWNERTNAINVKQFYVSNTLPAVKDITQYCNYFAKYNQSLYNYGAIGNFAILTNSRQFFGCVNSDLTLENFKTLLASNNLIVYYVLATPTEEEITNTTLIEQLEAISKAKSVKDKTYITQTNDDLPFILDVEAIKEYEVN